MTWLPQIARLGGRKAGINDSLAARLGIDRKHGCAASPRRVTGPQLQRGSGVPSVCSVSSSNHAAGEARRTAWCDWHGVFPGALHQPAVHRHADWDVNRLGDRVLELPADRKRTADDERLFQVNRRLDGEAALPGESGSAERPRRGRFSPSCRMRTALWRALVAKPPVEICFVSPLTMPSAQTSA